MLSKVLDLNLALKRQMNKTQPFCSRTPGISLSGLVGTRACTQTQQGKRAVGAQRKADLLCKWTDVGRGRERFLRGQSELGVKRFVLTDEYIAG